MKLAIHGAILAGAILLQTGCGGGSGGIGGMAQCGGAFTACGGDLTGKWSFDSVCAEGDLADSFMDTSGYPTECSGMVESVSLNLSGTLQYANGTETSDVTMTMNARFNYTKACLGAMAGMSIEVTQAICDAAAASADGELTCKLSGGGCVCTMVQTEQTQDSDTYTTSGGVLTYSGGDTMEYCVSGSNLTFRGLTDVAGVAMRIKTHRVQ